MAKRSIGEKKNTPIQGDDAWVLVTKPLVEEVEDVLNASEDVYESFAVGKHLLVDHIVDWNWVDYDDKPLPPPSKEPGIVGKLTLDEYQEIIRILLGAEEERKN